MDLTREQKIELLEGALEVLGPNGENWARGYWFARKPERFRPGMVVDIPADPPESANCWCLEGALCESAVRLGLMAERDADVGSALGQDVSLREQLGRPLFGFNDDPKTTWPDIRREVMHRIEKLKSERPIDEQRSAT